MKKYCYVMTTFFVIFGLFIAGCATTGESAGLGAALGAVAGGIIGHQSGHGVEGALIGAAIGGATGAIIGHERQKKLASRQQVEAEYYQTNTKKVVEPIAYWENFSVTPSKVKPGEKIMANGHYVLMGPPSAQPPSGTVKLTKIGNPPIEKASAKIEDVQEGRIDYEREITIPNDYGDGDYELTAEVVNGNSTAPISQTFTVARAQ